LKVQNGDARGWYFECFETAVLSTGRENNFLKVTLKKYKKKILGVMTKVERSSNTISAFIKSMRRPQMLMRLCII